MSSNRIILMVLAATAVSIRAPLTVFAAASMADAVKKLAEVYEADGGGHVHLNIASSGALARQIDAGAPADVFISANAEWMDWLAGRGCIEASSRFTLAGNSLVMIAPTGTHPVFGPGLAGRLAVGDFKSVPAGKYALEALESLGWLDELRPKLVPGTSVRTVLMYVERGEVEAGIVYASDARASGKVAIVGTFPAESHSPIAYPVAACSANGEAASFV